MKKVSIIIVNWNGKKDTIACLESLKKITTSPYDVSIIVVDNASADDSVCMITKMFPRVHVIVNKTNEGFTGGNNIGIEYAIKHGADFVWLLNNDTYVDRNVVIALANACSKETIGIAGSKIYFAPGFEYHHDRYKEKERGHVIWYAGGLIDWKNMYASHRGVDEIDKGQYDKQLKTEFVTGCSMMMKREVIEKVGYLDCRYYLYLEDLDYSLRTKSAGYSLLYVPEAVVWHKNAGSSAKPGNELHQYYITRNRLLAGMRYATLRTKIALLREGFRFIVGGPSIKRKAVLDFLFFRLGNRYTWKKTQ